MEIYLMQHGAAYAKQENPQQPLTEEGIRQIETAGDAIKRLGLSFELMISSSKTRSRQTAEIVAGSLGIPEEEIVVNDRFKPKVRAEESVLYLQQFQDRRRIFIAGHLPSLEEIASYLLTQGSKACIQFEHGGLCRIDATVIPTRAAVLRFALTQEHLRAIAASGKEDL